MTQPVVAVHDLCRVLASPAHHAQGVAGVGGNALEPSVSQFHFDPTTGRTDTADPLAGLEFGVDGVACDRHVVPRR